MKRLRVSVTENEHGILADLVFTARAKAVEEPRFTFRQGPRTIMDYTRLTQNGSYEGFIDRQGRAHRYRCKRARHARPFLGGAAHRAVRSARRGPATAAAILLAVGAAELSPTASCSITTMPMPTERRGTPHRWWAAWAMRSPCTWRVANRRSHTNPARATRNPPPSIGGR